MTDTMNGLSVPGIQFSAPTKVGAEFLGRMPNVVAFCDRDTYGIVLERRPDLGQQDYAVTLVTSQGDPLLIMGMQHAGRALGSRYYEDAAVIDHWAFHEGLAAELGVAEVDPRRPGAHVESLILNLAAQTYDTGRSLEEVFTLYVPVLLRVAALSFFAEEWERRLLEADAWTPEDWKREQARSVDRPVLGHLPAFEQLRGLVS